jgi:hypothetical protein
MERFLGAWLEDLGQESAAPSRAASVPPTLATSIVSSSSTIDESAQPFFRFTFSASGIGVRSPTAMSFVKWSPPIATTPVCHRLPRSKIARSAVPPPMSDDRDAQLLLVRRQDRFGRRQLLDDGVRHRNAGAVHARDDVLRGRHRAGE